MTEKSTDEVKPIVKEVKKEVNNFAQQSGANDLPF